VTSYGRDLRRARGDGGKDGSIEAEGSLAMPVTAVEMTLGVAKSEAEVGDLLGHGAKSVARGHYMSSELLGRRLELLRRLPLPASVQLQGKLIEVAADERGAKVIPLHASRLR
jgi:hypothetical protein